MSSFAEYPRYFRPRDPAELWEVREDWEYLSYKKFVSFNVEIFRILFSYQEMDTTFRLCGHPRLDLWGWNNGPDKVSYWLTVLFAVICLRAMLINSTS